MKKKNIEDFILIIDFGSQVTQLIARRFRELNIYCEIKPYQKINFNLLELKEWIDNREAAIDNLKPDNASRLIYFDSIPRKPAFSVL